MVWELKIECWFGLGMWVWDCLGVIRVYVMWIYVRVIRLGRGRGGEEWSK